MVSSAAAVRERDVRIIFLVLGGPNAALVPCIENLCPLRISLSSKKSYLEQWSWALRAHDHGKSEGES